MPQACLPLDLLDIQQHCEVVSTAVLLESGRQCVVYTGVFVSLHVHMSAHMDVHMCECVYLCAHMSVRACTRVLSGMISVLLATWTLICPDVLLPLGIRTHRSHYTDDSIRELEGAQPPVFSTFTRNLITAMSVAAKLPG